MRTGGDTGDTRAKEINVLIVGLPRLLADGVREAIEVEKDMVIVAQLDTSDALADTLEKPVDVIVTRATGGEPALPYRRALFGDRAIPVVAISAEGSIDVYSRRSTRGYGLKDMIGLIREAVADSQRTLEASDAGNRRLDH
jgi:DNA-binding NarL/FixJ family response regulator